jgi:hypothetical protein
MKRSFVITAILIALACVIFTSVQYYLDSPEVTQAAQEAGITANGEIERARLLKIATTEPIRGTNSLEIVVKHESRPHALANAFANAAVRLQKEHNQKRIKTRLQALKTELTSQEKHLDDRSQLRPLASHHPANAHSKSSGLEVRPSAFKFSSP